MCSVLVSGSWRQVLLVVLVLDCSATAEGAQLPPLNRGRWMINTAGAATAVASACSSCTGRNASNSGNMCSNNN